MPGRRGTGEVVDLIDFKPQRMRDIVADEFKVRLVQQMLDVRLLAGEEVVNANDIIAARDEPIAEVRPEEAGAASDEDALDHGVSMRPKKGNAVNSTQFRGIVRFLKRFGAAIAAIASRRRCLLPPRWLRRSLTVNPQKHRAQGGAVGAI